MRFDLWTSPALQLKLGLVVFVIALALLHLRFPRWYALQGAILVTTLAIVWLGLEITR